MDYEKIIIAIIVIVLLPLITYLISYAVKFLKEKAGQINNQTIKEIVLEAINSVEQAVLFVMQTYVDSLKAAGTFSQAAQEEALKKATETAKKLITENAQAIIEDAYGDFETWLRTRIEQTVRDTKKEAATDPEVTTTAAATAASVATTIAQTAAAQLNAEAATPLETPEKE